MASSQISLPLYDRKFPAIIACTDIEDEQAFSPVQEISYDEFCMSLSRTHEPVQLKARIPCEVEETSPHNGGTYSRVHDWRKNVDFRVEVGPPASPLITSEFPASPVAVIHPSSLRMSWKPNYDSVSCRAMSSSPELGSASLVDKPTQFQDLYDAELEQLMDELSELQSSATSDSDTISVYVPPG
ncbi:hypothetical protein AAF712_008041 [Marasmius tenuissimus]|uniref:Uncharacterized protein n=1 Tax=Marasmius tenuissimus TaxID=585030 RepID=A0ABR2ZTN2_9AGAR